MSKTKLLIACILMVVLGGLFYNMTISDKTLDPNLKETLTMPGVKSGVTDSLGQLGIESTDDVKYQIKGKKMNFIYGNQRFYIKISTLEDPEMKKIIKQLRLKIENNGDGTYTVKYKGKEISEWVS